MLDEIVDVLKDDLLVYPDGINDDQDLINYILENEYMEIKRYAKGGTMKIRKSNPEARKSFRARHNCDNPGPKTKARYWSCYQWRAGAKVDN